MSTPRVSGSLDQMRRMQISASVGGECAQASATGEATCGFAGARFSEIARASTGEMTVSLAAESFLASGCAAGAVFFSETAQHVLFAQQPGGHASLLGAFERMHDCAGRRIGARHSAAAKPSATVILLNIESLLSTIEAARRTAQINFALA